MLAEERMLQSPENENVINGLRNKQERFRIQALKLIKVLHKLNSISRHTKCFYLIGYNLVKNHALT